MPAENKSEMFKAMDFLKYLKKAGMHQGKEMVAKRLRGKSEKAVNVYVDSLRGINSSPVFEEDHGLLPEVPEDAEVDQFITIGEQYWEVLSPKISRYERKASAEAVKNLIEGVGSSDLCAINLLGKYSRDDLYEFFKDTSVEELQLILSKPIASETSLRIKDILMEKDFATTLNLFESSNYLIPTQTRRIFITDEGVCDSLKKIYEYQQKRDCVHTLGGLFAWVGGSASHARQKSLELAWGLLDSLSKHKTDHPFVTSSLATAKWAISSLGACATIVLDGHGGRGTADIANHIYHANKPFVLSEMMRSLLVDYDVGGNIDHIILQTCASGQLAADEELLLLKKTASPQKQRATFFSSRDTAHSSLIVDNTIAAGIYAGIVAAKRQNNIAFTFSENLINPGNELGSGNLGVQKIEDRESSCLRKTYKSISIIPEGKHRKSPLNTDEFVKSEEQAGLGFGP